MREYPAFMFRFCSQRRITRPMPRDPAKRSSLSRRSRRIVRRMRSCDTSLASKKKPRMSKGRIDTKSMANHVRR